MDLIRRKAKKNVEEEVESLINKIQVDYEKSLNSISEKDIILKEINKLLEQDPQYLSSRSLCELWSELKTNSVYKQGSKTRDKTRKIRLDFDRYSDEIIKGIELHFGKLPSENMLIEISSNYNFIQKFQDETSLTDDQLSGLENSINIERKISYHQISNQSNNGNNKNEFNEYGKEESSPRSFILSKN